MRRVHLSAKHIQINKNEPPPSRKSLGGFDHEPTQEEIELVRNLFLLHGAGSPRVVVFAGVASNDGCPHVCGRASQTLAGVVSGSVCIVDGNFRAPSLDQYFGVPNLKGLTESTHESGPIRQFAQQLSGSNLWLLPSGFHQVDPEPFLSSQSFFSRVAEMRDEFDHVLVVAPPVNLYSDASLLGRLSDGFVLVVEANSTRREQALKARETLEAANVNVLGAVLNNRTFPIPEVIYNRL
jgi:Mrp family chromosome partitioning ATPase